MKEQELIEAMNRALEPISTAHQEYLTKTLEAVKNAFEIGLEIGKKLYAKETQQDNQEL